MLRQTNIYFYLRKGSNKQTVYCRISVGDEQSSRSTGLKVDPKHWNKETQRMKGTSNDTKAVNETLSVIESQVRQAENTLCSRHEQVTLEKILSLVEDDTPTITILGLFYEHNQKLKERVGIDIRKATYTKYCTIEKQIKAFLKETYEKEDCYMSELNLKFIEDLEHWWKTKHGLAHNTTLKYMKHFRKILLIGMRRGYLRRDPMDGWNRKKKKKVPTHLTIQELRRIEEYDFSEVERLDQVRDIFVFGCYTGLAYSDLKKLDRDDFFTDQQGDLWLMQQRTKTDEPANVLLFPKAVEIYNKYAHLNEGVLPVISNQNMNAYLKEIATVCKVKKRLTTHVARHTFATTITLGNGAPLESVQIMMGHSDRRSTEHYARVTNHRLTQDMKELRRRLEAKG